MIVPMKKIAVITTDKYADSSVDSLRKLGVVHVEHAQPPKGDDIDKLNEDIAFISHAIDILSIKEFSSGGAAPAKKITDWPGVTRHIIDLYKRLEQLDEYSSALANRIAQFEHWGDFEPKKIDELKKKNIFIRFYQAPVSELGLFPKGAVVKNIYANSGIVNCAVVSQGEIGIPFKEVVLPKAGLGELKQRQAQDKQAMRAIKDELVRLHSHSSELSKVKDALMAQLEFRQAVRGMASESGIAYLTGYVPQDNVEALTAAGKKEKWGILARDPAEDDNVPVLLRTPYWVSFIRPLLNLLEVVPGYRELDVSALFLVFFSIFFGIIIGDAGYGLVYLGATFFIRRKMGDKVSDNRPFLLFYVLSSCAIIWGVLSGTFFGQEWLAKFGIKPLVKPLGDLKFFQTFCFFLGAVHLSIGRGWQAVLKFPGLVFLADVGWICVLWAGFFLAKTLILGDSFPIFAKWLMITGMGMIVLFTNPKRNILKAAASGLGTLALGLVNSFTDVVSYIRLFAVGLAGLAIADTVNALAQGAGGNIIAAVLIIFAGHTVNIVLGPMSVLVHGVRLNVLEFSGHAGLTWSGTAYKPLREKEEVQ